jgi:hypothetical protein
MRRDENSILRSQQKMKGQKAESAPFGLIQNMKAETDLMEAWLNRYPHVSYISIWYEETMKFPETIAKRLADFVGANLNQKQAINAIDGTLNHYAS